VPQSRDSWQTYDIGGAAHSLILQLWCAMLHDALNFLYLSFTSVPSEKEIVTVSQKKKKKNTEGK